MISAEGLLTSADLTPAVLAGETEEGKCVRMIPGFSVRAARAGASTQDTSTNLWPFTSIPVSRRQRSLPSWHWLCRARYPAHARPRSTHGRLVIAHLLTSL